MTNGQRKEGTFGRMLAHAAPAAAVEQRIVEGALARMEARPRRRPWVLPAAIAATAAAAAGIFALLWSSAGDLPPGGARRVARHGDHATLAPHVTVSATAATGSLRYRVSSHDVSLSVGARLALQSSDAASPRLRLDAGKATFRVQPLASGHTFVVQTDHVRVEVVGTRFSVTTDVRCSTVRVTHGVVRASSTSIEGPGHRLRAGMSRRFCRRAEKRHAGLGEGDALVREALSLLGDASSAEKLRHADRLLTSYLKRFARGPLAEEALFHLVFIKHRLHDAKASEALARQFLQRFPSTRRAARLRRYWPEKKRPATDQR